MSNKKSLFSIILYNSLASGAVLGASALIPPLSGLALAAVMFLPAPLILYQLNKLNLTGGADMNQYFAAGSACGFFAFLGFSLAYLPAAFILHLIFKTEAFLWVKVMLGNAGYILAIVILTALLCGLFNMFSAFITAYFSEYLRPKNRG